MKFSTNFKKFTITLLVLAISTLPVLSQELRSTGFKSNAVELVPSNKFVDFKHNYDRPQEAVFRILDSLQNAYSYFTNDQQPFVYYSPKGELITIKRGADVNGASTNSLNDLYVLTSKDWGYTWSAPIEVYKASNEPGNNARYPSVYAFEYEGDMAYVYTAPLTGGAGWLGYVNGLLYQGIPIPIVQKTFDIDGTTYGWGGTDSKIVGGVVGADPYGLATSNLMTTTGLPLTKTSSLGQRKTLDFETWTPTIPPAWDASKFVEPTPEGTFTDSLRTSVTFTMSKELADNKIYFTAFGRFLAADYTEKWLPAVSVSEDDGETWSEFEIFPWSVISAYATQLQINPEAINVDRGAGDFVNYPNGDYSYFVSLNEDTTMTGTLYANALHQIVELYKEGTQFGLRPVADNTGYVLAYIGDTGTNQMGNELMASRTVDGSKVVVKWVDFVDAIDGNGDTVKNYSTDIFFAAKEKDKKTWSRAKDITDSEIYDRITWIPDFLPNDLKGIPVLKLESVPNANDTPADARTRQRTLETERQYVLVSNFDADDLLIVGVEDYDTSYEVGNVYPNPAYDKVLLDINLPQTGNLNIDLVDLFGRTVKNVYNNSANGGFTAINLYLGNQPTGVYFLRISFNGNVTSKTINIIK